MNGSPKFETARVCVQRRERNEAYWGDRANEPEFRYEVVAWPPGPVDGGLLPQIGDHLTLPGYNEQTFWVVERALHWPAPTSPEARRGELVCDLLVEPVSAAWAKSRPGRPGEQEIQEDGRWFCARVSQFSERPLQSRPQERVAKIDFQIAGVGQLPYWVRRNFQAQQMFPGRAFNLAARGGLQEVLSRLWAGQEFEVLVAPGRNGHLEIREVRAVRAVRSDEPEEES